MKFANYLEHITGVSIYPLISLLVFFIFFVVLLFFVVKMDKKLVAEVAALPMDNDEDIKNESYV